MSGDRCEIPTNHSKTGTENEVVTSASVAVKILEVSLGGGNRFYPSIYFKTV